MCLLFNELSQHNSWSNNQPGQFVLQKKGLRVGAPVPDHVPVHAVRQGRIRSRESGVSAKSDAKREPGFPQHRCVLGRMLLVGVRPRLGPVLVRRSWSETQRC